MEQQEHENRIERTTLRLPANLWEQLREISYRTRISLNELIVTAVERYLQTTNHGKK